ncbi:centrosomal protein of 128 kDa isoform X1 [Sinocyclocheilus rhinocerous]|uniref:Centrosomal protein 128 n=1 Tax=Sinocyclocheilus rhinocerous TaxID=307959 RepID=A0A673KIB5_9TELE|nr:PREDICTED: centrosomal protein of 128 kDa isoform X1 [Sinocyclocheilus rhinocerous]XP_016418074.1 PREDICTED: centrosomal protein of 128 kDa isoform X1 [Sinocyclocheilus rhinocerous]XP_016418075.1 PREDICTED: centrosomal protein of 128 kDa isoform X1 [Sinocyclocheilus rhinocerous]
MDSSSESDTYDRPTGHRSRVRKRRTRPDSGFPRDTHVSDISDKIDTLANTLQDTSRNLNKVDQMLGQYKEHTDDQAEAMVTLRESLEESIQHLQAQQLRRSTAGWSASLSTLHTSDLDDGSATDRRRYLPTSPLRDYGSAGTGNRRRSRSVAVRFTDSAQAEEQIHSLHQSLRDLQSDQLRIGDDIDREIRRRNRTDIETKKTLENLAGHIKASQKEEPVSLRVERRLQEIEDEMRTGRQVLSERHHREKPKSMSGELQEALRRHDAQTPEADENFRNRLQRSENERSKMQQELERLREQLDQSEGGRDTLLQKMDDMRSQLLRMEKERLDLQRELSLLLSQQKSARRQQERGVTGLDSGRTELEREIEDLRVQLGRISVSSEVEELKKSVERKEREKTQLAFRVEALSADLERREQQQLKMLAQLKEIQSRSEENVSECGRLEAQLIESERRREELRSKAQEAVRQWKTKCKKLEREFQELKDNSRNNTDKDKRSKEREGILSQQLEGARQQLADALGRLAHREEDVRRCNVDLTETRSQLVTLELELQEARETLRGLEEKAQKQISLQVQMREENVRLQKRVELQEHSKEEEQRSLLDLQGSVKNLSAARADLAARLAEVESSKKDLEKQLAMAQEESSSFGRQLELERQVHQKELSHLRMTQQEGKAQQDRDVHDMLRLYQREREELEALVRDLKSEAVADSELRRALQLKLDKMKTECDKLTEQLSTSEENHAKLLHKYHTLKKELDVKGKLAEREEERRQSAEHSMEELHERVTGLQTEQESILHAVGTQIDSACQFLSKDSAAKLEAITLTPGLQKDSHRWLAEVKTKLQWLCEEVRERESRERRLRRTLQQHKEQMKALKQSKDSELQSFLDRITLQDRLLKDIQSEKRGLLEMGRKKEDEMRNLQDRIVDLEMSTRLALDHLESVPEKLSLLENFKDLEESQKQREMVEQRYAKYKEIVGNLQHQLEESKKRIQEYRDEKLDAACRSLQLTSLTSSLLSQSNFLTDTTLSTHTSPQKPLASPDLESSLTQEHFSTFNGANSKHTSM